MQSKRGTAFWLAILALQIAYGAAVFGVARYLYKADNNLTNIGPDVVQGGNGDRTPTDAGLKDQLLENLGMPSIQSSDPVEISRRANDAFQQQRYTEAASLYERLLDFGPQTADVHNNLGLTLHYLGRTDEALQRLDEGIQIEPDNQRIWLTLGFVNRQVGDNEAARNALETAANMDAESSVGRSARQMLDELP